MNIKFKVMKLRELIIPVMLIALSIAAGIPALNSGKADSNVEKTVYFTFDDGPSERTEEILEILKRENIKATFFVIGPSDEKTDERIFKIHEEGHSIGLHTMSHSYEKIYLTSEGFINDLEAEREWIYSVTGEECMFFRFPGGSTNSNSPKWLIEEVKQYAKEKKMKWYDWNADGRDSLGALLSPEEIVKNVLSSEFIGKEKVVVLLHDSAGRTTTPEALEILIEEFRKMGYVFEKLG